MLLTLLSSLIFGATPAQDTRQEGAALFSEGRRFATHGRYAEACPLFERSYALQPALGTLLNLADCLEKLGRHTAAYLRFNQAAAWAARNRETPRQRLAEQRSSEIKARLPFIAFRPTDRAVVVELRLLARGQPSEIEWKGNELSESYPVDPGTYELELKADQHAGRVLTVEVADQPGVMVVDLPALEPLAPPVAEGHPPPPLPLAPRSEPAPRPVAEAHASPAGPAPLRAWQVASLAVGGVALVAGATGVAYSRTVFDRYQRQQPGGPDAAAPTVTRREYQTTATLYPASFIVGGCGAALVATALIAQLFNAPAPTVALAFDPQHLGASVVVAF